MTFDWRSSVKRTRKSESDASSVEFEALVAAALRVDPKGLAGKHSSRKGDEALKKRPGEEKK
jgi:hypothetical protein